MIQEKQEKAIRSSKPKQLIRDPRSEHDPHTADQRSSSVPEIRKSLAAKEEDSGPKVAEKGSRVAKTIGNSRLGIYAANNDEEIKPEPGSRNKYGRHHASSFHEDEANAKNDLLAVPNNIPAQSPSQNQLDVPNSKLNKGGKSGKHNSNQLLFTEGPLNTYQDFKNVFNAKHLGPKTNRRQAHQPAYLSSENLQGKDNEEKAIRSSSQSVKGASNIGNLHNPNSILQQNLKYEQ